MHNYMVSSNYSYLIICLHTVIWFQEFLSSTNDFQTDLSNPLDGFLTSATTLGQSRPESNGNKGVLQTSQNFKTETLPPDSV